MSLIVLVASLALLADLALIIANKREDLGMLLTLGATPAGLRRAFLCSARCWRSAAPPWARHRGGAAVLFDRLHLIRLPGDVFFVDYVPFLVRPRDLVLILAVTLGLALAASLYGAAEGGRARPGGGAATMRGGR